MADAFFAIGLLAYLAGAVASLVSFRRPTVARIAGCTFALLGSLLETIASLTAILRGAAAVWTLPFGVPLFSWSVRLDPLSAFFNLALAILAGAVSVYSLGYLRHWEAHRTGLTQQAGGAGAPIVMAELVSTAGAAPLSASSSEGRGNLGAFGFFYNVLLLSLTLVFTAANAFFFLAAWEVMALSAFCLVAFEHEKDEARNAGVLFLIMSHAGTALLLIAFIVLSTVSGSLDFSTFHLLASKLAPLQQGTIFLLFFAGFGVKAGIIPLHIWLPEAHPVAPSNISAIMSGIVIKTGIYGMARVFFDFFGPPPLWMGTLVLAIAVVTALLGVLYALMEHDLKRLLAYHSIENVGIILMGFGAALMFRALGHPDLAAIALIAGLYHTLNHAIFKGLLFLGAGAVVHATHTRNMEEMGGLIRRMPVTALGFLIGAVAISGLPPLNGFVSEWLTYQALLAGFGTTSSLTRVMFPLAGALLALTAALAAACFVKAFAIPFLALPRSEKAANAHESPVSMQIAMGLLAAGCVVLGLGASWFLPLFDPITYQAVGVRVSSSLVAANGFAIAAGSPRGGTVSTLGIAFLFLALSAVPAILWLRWGRYSPRSVGPAWDCGLPGLTADNQYTATAFSKPLRMIFSALYRPRREIQADYEISPYYPTAIRFESEIEPAFEKRLYGPLKDFILGLAGRMRAIQAGSIHAYLAYIFIALILLLLFAVRS